LPSIITGVGGLGTTTSTGEGRADDWPLAGLVHIAERRAAKTAKMQAVLLKRDRLVIKKNSVVVVTYTTMTKIAHIRYQMEGIIDNRENRHIRRVVVALGF
jgi:hypothetical protein